jgi:LysM repeat protein
MTRRSPARLLAPLALVAVAVALYAIVKDADRSASTGTPEQVTTTKSTGSGRTSSKTTPARTTRRRRYTVKAGDTPSGIAEDAGITVERLLELNPRLDPQSLSPGTRLRLR